METDLDDNMECELYPSIHQRTGNGPAAMVVESSKLTPLLVALAVIAVCMSGVALGISITNMNQSSQAQADMRSRYEQSYRELATKVAINTNSTDDMRASLIARGINPNNHDITDLGGTSP